jgi:iron complex transport system ATP-binding protein
MPLRTAAPSASALGCRNLSVAYGKRRVIEGMTLAIPRARWTSVVGPNGCGKSTLLRALAGLMEPVEGSRWLEGVPLESWSRRDRARRLAWLAQTTTPTDLTAYECVALGRFAHTGWLRSREAQDEAAINRALAATGALGSADRRLSTLSGGERQRVHLARVLAVGASVLLLDEPTTHLDPPHQEEIGRILQSQAREGGATILSAIHDLSLALTADRMIVMGPRGLVGQGTVAEVLEGDWLSEAFETPIRIIRHEGSYLWQPRLGTRVGAGSGGS